MSKHIHKSFISTPNNICARMLSKCCCTSRPGETIGHRNFSNAPDYTGDDSIHAEEEAKKFSDLSPHWWDGNGSFQALHSMNEVRVPFIRDSILYRGYSIDGKPNTSTPLKEVDLLDVGCGGGILSEPLARLGASVCGIDLSDKAIEAAKQHRPLKLKNLQYLNATVDDFVAAGTLKFDAVIASEIIEHLSNPSDFIGKCSTVLHSGGSLILSTINRTAISYLLAIGAAEKLFNIVPEETHNWNRFVTVEELTTYCNAADFHIRKIHGLCYNPFLNQWSFTNNYDVNYIVHAIKKG